VKYEQLAREGASWAWLHPFPMEIIYDIKTKRQVTELARKLLDNEAEREPWNYKRRNRLGRFVKAKGASA
jgi:hypothetical protein